jgi:hypothetical protein
LKLERALLLPEHLLPGTTILWETLLQLRIVLPTWINPDELLGLIQWNLRKGMRMKKERKRD